MHDNESEGGRGKYFEFEREKWLDYFGITGGGTKVEDVKQCRNGATVWSGDVRVWGLNSNDHELHGRRNSGEASGDWGENDYLVTVCGILQ